MRTCVAHPAAKHHHSRIEQGSIFGILGLFEKIEETCELLGIKGFDDVQLLEQIRPLAMVGQGVVSVCDAVKGKETITTGMSESDDFGQIGLQPRAMSSYITEVL